MTEKQECERCEGSGVCLMCDEEGKATCRECGYGRNCVYCDGTKECFFCGGSGVVDDEELGLIE